MQSFLIKRGDTSPSLLYALLPASIVLTGATVRFSMRQRDVAAPVISRELAAIVTETGTPTVRYDWAAVDTAEAGIYEGEFEITFSDGSIETFPNAGYIPIIIHGDIA